jgi:hypothetical protein
MEAAALRGECLSPPGGRRWHRPRSLARVRPIAGVSRVCREGTSGCHPGSAVARARGRLGPGLRLHGGGIRVAGRLQVYDPPVGHNGSYSADALPRRTPGGDSSARHLALTHRARRRLRSARLALAPGAAPVPVSARAPCASQDGSGIRSARVLRTRPTSASRPAASCTNKVGSVRRPRPQAEHVSEEPAVGFHGCRDV